MQNISSWKFRRAGSPFEKVCSRFGKYKKGESGEGFHTGRLVPYEAGSEPGVDPREGGIEALLRGSVGGESEGRFRVECLDQKYG